MRALVLAVIVAAAATAHADDDDAEVGALIDRAYAERDALRYREAIAAIDTALGIGRASPAQMRALYRLGGELHAGLDEPDVAQRWFARWLALVPDGRLRPDTSPKITAPLEAARAQMGGRAIELHVARAGDGLVIQVTGDVLGAIDRVQVRGDGAVWGGASGEYLWLPAGAAVAVGVDVHGNALIGMPIDLPPLRARRPLYQRWHPYALNTAILTVAGGLFAWRTSVAQGEFDRLRADSTAHTLAELEDVRDRGERHALFANISFGAAAVSAAVAIAFAIRGSDEPAVTVGALAGPDGAGVALSGRF